MRRAAAVIAALAVLPGAANAKKPQRKKCEVVVFKRKGKTIRRCRLVRPKIVVPAPSPPPGAPLPAAPPAPAPAPAPAPSPPPRPPTTTDQPPPQQRDPWFLTLYARDVGNGDFRLLPAPGQIPAGTLFLSYKNEDATEHDLRLRSAGGEQLIFPAASTKELRRTQLELAPGRYEFLCGLEGHEAMRQAFEVTP